MKKIVFIILALALLLSSCETSVGITYMVPSLIDMGNHRNIALASTVPYYGFTRPSRYIRTLDSLARYGYPYVLSSYSWGLKDDIADYATERIYETLSASGYFTVLPPEETDKILDLGSIGFSSRESLLERGIDAVIIPRIDNMSVNEYLYSRVRTETREDSKGNEYEVDVTYFYYDADYQMKLSYTIIDVNTEKIIASRSFVIEDSDSYRLTNPNFLSNYPERSFRRMVDSTLSKITRQLIPLRTTAEITLMGNKPKNEEAEAAYTLVKDGNRFIQKADQMESEICSGLDRQEKIQLMNLEEKLLTQLSRMEQNEKNRQEVYLP